MPKLRCPSDDVCEAALASMWLSVDSEYVLSHREAANWSSRSIEASKRYSADAQRRARPILKWIRCRCQQGGVSHHVAAVHLIDHSRKPPEVVPYLLVDIQHPKALWFTAQVKCYGSKSFAVVRDQITKAIDACLAVAEKK